MTYIFLQGCLVDSGTPCVDPISDPFGRTCEFPHDPIMEQVCDNGFDEDGNDLGRYAIPYYETVDCPAYCDPVCGPQEERCYDFDSNGCMLPMFCVPLGECYPTMTRDGCYIYESVEPAEDEIVCSGKLIDVSRENFKK